MNQLTKKLSAGGCALALGTIGWAFAQSQTSHSSDATANEPLQVTLVAPPYAVYTRKSVPLRVTFENNDEKNIRLLRQFKPVKSFFDITLQTSTGTNVPVEKTANSQTAPPKSAPVPEVLQYVDLGFGESFGTLVDVSELLPPALPEGRYIIRLTYRNQQGENCFKGTKTTNPVSVEIVDEPVTEVSGAISEQKAIVLARKAIEGKITLKPNAEVSVRNTAKQFIVTFGGPPPAGTLGSDYDARVFINRMTGEVENVLAGS